MEMPNPMHDEMVRRGDFITLSSPTLPSFVKFTKLHPDAKMPCYAKPGDSGADLYSVEDVFIPVGSHIMVSSGIAIQLPLGYEGQVRSRSGLAAKGVQVANGIGTIDNAYRGEVKTILYNFNCSIDWQMWPRHQNEYVNLADVKPGDTVLSKRVYGINIKKGDRIAQLVIVPVSQFEFKEVEKLDETDRGSGGFGSSGR